MSGLGKTLRSFLCVADHLKLYSKIAGGVAPFCDMAAIGWIMSRHSKLESQHWDWGKWLYYFKNKQPKKLLMRRDFRNGIKQSWTLDAFPEEI